MAEQVAPPDKVEVKDVERQVDQKIDEVMHKIRAIRFCVECMKHSAEEKA